LSFDHVIIRDVEGERRVEASALPLRIGTGSDCDLRLPGPGGKAVALFDLLDGTPFVQPVGRAASLTINAQPLETSKRLADGDALEFYGSRILVAIDDGRLSLDVRLEDSAYVTRPPEVDDEEALPDEEAIAPTAFRRVAETSAQLQKERTSPLRYIVGTLLVFLLTASYLLFSAKSVQFEIDPPEPDAFDIDGGWFRLPIGDRTLLRKGDYTVNVQKRGYFDVKQTFVVGDEPSMTLELAMRKKPGRLYVQIEPPVDAVVTVNDSQVGKAPFGPVELEPGEHSVEVESERYLLAIVGVLNAVIAAYYYLRLISVMWMKEPEEVEEFPMPVSGPTAFVVVVAVIAVFWLGIFPGWVLDLTRGLAALLV